MSPMHATSTSARLPFGLQPLAAVRRRASWPAACPSAGRRRPWRSIVSCTRRRVCRIHGGLAQLQRDHLAQALEARDHGLGAAASRPAMRVEERIALGVVQRVATPACRRRCDTAAAWPRTHGRSSTSGRKCRRNSAHSSVAMCCAVGIGVGEDADLVVAQVRDVRGARITPMAMLMSCTSSEASDLPVLQLPGVQDLAAQRHDRLEVAVARLLRRTAGRIALDQEQLGALGILRACSRRACRAAPGRRSTRLRVTRCAGLAGAPAHCSMANCAMRSPRPDAG